MEQLIDSRPAYMNEWISFHIQSGIPVKYRIMQLFCLTTNLLISLPRLSKESFNQCPTFGIKLCTLRIIVSINFTEELSASPTFPTSAWHYTSNGECFHQCKVCREHKSWSNIRNKYIRDIYSITEAMDEKSYRNIPTDWKLKGRVHQSLNSFWQRIWIITFQGTPIVQIRHLNLVGKKLQ